MPKNVCLTLCQKEVLAAQMKHVVQGQSDDFPQDFSHLFMGSGYWDQETGKELEGEGNIAYFMPTDHSFIWAFQMYGVGDSTNSQVV